MNLSPSVVASRPRWTRWALLGAGLLTLLAAWFEPFFLRYIAAGLPLIVGMVAAIVAWGTPRGSRVAPITYIAGAVGIVAQIGWLLSNSYPMWAAAQLLGVIVAFSCFAGFWSISRTRRRVLAEQQETRVHRSALDRLRSVGNGVLVAAAAVVSAVILTTTLSPGSAALATQTLLDQVSSYDARGPEGATSITENGDQLISDVAYGDEHPNSYLDIYIADNDSSVDRPTYIYIHGGGWIGGTKSTGDPNAANGGFPTIVDPVLDGGYNLVSLDYGLAPTVEYPTQVKQISQAVTFLQENADQYGLDMSTVVVGGASAGGQLTGQFANIQTNPEYAAQVGVEPVIGEELKAVVLDSAALELDLLDESQAPEPIADFIYNLSGRTYFGASEARFDEGSVTNHVTENFPPAFISDGNVGTFPDQAETLHERLDTLGVLSETYLPPLSDAELVHGFMAQTSEWTDTYNVNKLAFLDALTANQQ